MNRNQIGWSEVLLFKCAISITLGVQSVVGTRTLRRRARVMAAGGGGREVFLVVLRLSSSDTPQHTSHHVDKREEERQRAPGCEMASRWQCSGTAWWDTKLGRKICRKVLKVARLSHTSAEGPRETLMTGRKLRNLKRFTQYCTNIYVRTQRWALEYVSESLNQYSVVYGTGCG